MEVDCDVAVYYRIVIIHPVDNWTWSLPRFLRFPVTKRQLQDAQALEAPLGPWCPRPAAFAESATRITRHGPKAIYLHARCRLRLLTDSIKAWKTKIEISMQCKNHRDRAPLAFYVVTSSSFAASFSCPQQKCIAHCTGWRTKPESYSIGVFY